jgi:PAS domain S-box-containing protein
MEMKELTVVGGEEESRATLISELLSLREEITRWRFHLGARGDLRALSEHVPFGVCTVAPDGRLRYANPRFSAMHGYSRQECIGEELAFFFRPDQHAKLGCLVEGAATGDAFTAVPFWHVTRDGGAFPALCGLFSLPGLDAEPPHIVLITMENGPLETAESELRRVVALLDVIGDGIEVGRFTVDVSTRVLSWSPQAARISGRELDRSAPEGIALDELAHPDDRMAVREWLRQGLRACAAVTAEFRIRRPDGEVRWVHGCAARLEMLQNAPQCVQGLIQDVTERRLAREALRESQARHRFLVDALPTPYQCLDPEGQILEVNACWLQTLGFRIEEVLGRPFDGFLEAGCRTRFKEALAQPPAPVPDVSASFRIRRADGGFITLLYRRCPCFDEAGKLRQVIFQFFGAAGRGAKKEKAAPRPSPGSSGSRHTPAVILTPREMEVCRHIRDGLSSKEIASRLSISPKSVQTHRNHIRRKLGLLNQAMNLVGYLRTHSLD